MNEQKYQLPTSIVHCILLYNNNIKRVILLWVEIKQCSSYCIRQILSTRIKYLTQLFSISTTLEDKCCSFFFSSWFGNAPNQRLKIKHRAVNRTILVSLCIHLHMTVRLRCTWENRCPPAAPALPLIDSWLLPIRSKREKNGEQNKCLRRQRPFLWKRHIRKQVSPISKHLHEAKTDNLGFHKLGNGSRW